ncbi:ABC transporter ATP-binding protein [Rhizobium ruizarguesonis]|jgi:multiple sugar transport system ATP-binding protein|uniref:Sn-glycerol-3-phosphate ABC transporter ATP-binding protein UgpC n=1 Tax=Rhizobium ruizarguesonis TaxID=2081791 RepID=A0AB38I8K8_9HYPH|nr:sn-glycerol-3-phosphate ABC transporter ATP-binding protein UgpC [Rhizobium ruizarguesonis]MBY5804315.1 sn-glycerol-3-phosphate ABC transporter ATP-binding protein UgpC [Rhizobium leguminosarum]NKL12987.1 sn-glycerol-3-phosphate ABC transporter ATP-binding protein UgpC [Rhizobium leguminosarum bv. viciae]MBY5844878.1 sn-glycerol-3-phosphate ABC transporter ATP-binding protein UgpC [Rhizobium leguminosarum]NEH86525.1 sn-glycerol-3-phosphate ABC transporter ATP-binding protein UgpC [Rhizobium 
MSTLELRNIHKSYGAVNIIKDVNLSVYDREFVVLVGPSGCGKSTLLRMIAGLEEITGGELTIDGEVMNDVSADARGLAMVFQSYALYPHMTVSENMGFALKLAKVPESERNQKILKAAKILQLEHLLERKPKQLSGGQRQRVAIGRAIVRQPKIFLFDEPLSNLDAALRVQMRIELAELHRRLNATMIYVTHDQVEAMTMADRIVVLRDGIIEQVGTPLELYNSPANTFVAGFIGSPKMNLIEARVTEVEGGNAKLFINGGSTLNVAARPGLKAGDTVTVGLRPESIGPSDTGTVTGVVDVVEHLGSETLCYINLGSGPLLTAKLDSAAPVAVGDTMKVGVLKGKPILFAQSGEALGDR